MNYSIVAILVALLLSGCLISKEPYLRPSSIWPYRTNAVELVPFEFKDGNWKRSNKPILLSRAENGWFDLTSNDGKESSTERIMFEELGGGFFIAMQPWSKSYVYNLIYRDSGSTALYYWTLNRWAMHWKSRNLVEHLDVELVEACLFEYSKRESFKDSGQTVEVEARSALLGYMKACARYVENKRVAPSIKFDIRLK